MGININKNSVKVSEDMSDIIEMSQKNDAIMPDSEVIPLFTKLRSIVDGYDLLLKESLHKAIIGEVNKYNNDHPEKKVTTLQVYTWILGDENRARTEIRKAVGATLTRAKERTDPNEAFGTWPGQSDIDVNRFSLDALMNGYISGVKQQHLPTLNIGKLESFLGSFSQLSLAQNETDLLKRIFLERNTELRQYPEKTHHIVLSLISSLKAFCNGNATVDYNFDESSIKHQILSDYSETLSGSREIMSNIDGRMRGISIILDSSSSYYFQTLKQVLQAKKNESDFSLKCLFKDESYKTKFIEYLKQQNFQYPPPNLLFVNANDTSIGRFDVWARDGAVRLSNGTIIEPKKHYSKGNAAAYDSLIPVEGSDIVQSELVFQGGNMRATDNMLFLGSDDIFDTIHANKHLVERYNRDHDKCVKYVVRLFEKEFGKKVMVIGKMAIGKRKVREKQGIFHIDMCMTPLGNHDMLFAGPIQGSSPKQNEFLKEERQRLVENGYNIISLPYFNSGDFYITYNNSLIEKYTDSGGKKVKKVYLPQYYAGKEDDPVYSYSVGDQQLDLEKMNKEAMEVYKQQGFEVVPIDISVSIISRSGSLNCLTFEDR